MVVIDGRGVGDSGYIQFTRGRACNYVGGALQIVWA